MTDTSNNLQLNGYQLSMIQKGNNFNSQSNLGGQRLKGTEVFSKGQINFGGEPFSGGSGGTGTISSHKNLSLQGRHQTQKQSSSGIPLREEDDFDYEDDMVR